MNSTSSCEECGAPVERRRPTGPVPRFCDQKCNHKHWVKNNRERVKVSSARSRSKPEARAKKREQSRRRNAEQPLYFARLFWNRKARWVNYRGGSCPCGERRLPCLDFDHRDPSTKRANVSSMIRYTKRYTEAQIREEVDKCDVLCANCHRLKTSERWYDVSHEFE